MQRRRGPRQESGHERLELSTAISNATAQDLYETQGWQRDQEFYYYSKKI